MIVMVLRGFLERHLGLLAGLPAWTLGLPCKRTWRTTARASLPT